MYNPQTFQSFFSQVSQLFHQYRSIKTLLLIRQDLGNGDVGSTNSDLKKEVQTQDLFSTSFTISSSLI